jgi:predicted nucleic acid-binding protein
LIFIDTNVLMYAAGYEQADRPKRERALRLLTGGECAMSGQVLAEFYFNATRATKLNLPHAVAIDWIEDFRRFPIVPITADLVALGAATAARYQISYWDGAIIAAAQEIGAETLYSEDLSAGQRYGSVRVVNPFADRGAI